MPEVAGDGPTQEEVDLDPRNLDLGPAEMPLTFTQNSDPADEADLDVSPAVEGPEESEMGYDALIGDLHTWIASSLDLSEAMAKMQPSRELSLVITKLEEAEMWLIKLFPGTSEGGEE